MSRPRRPERIAAPDLLAVGRRAPSQLELLVVGLDHTTAAVDLREQVAFTDAEIGPALERLTDPVDPLLEQAAILSTCNRVELYGAARSRPSRHELAALLARPRGLDPAALLDALYVHRGDEAAHHLAATAAGMHSLVPGEAQIQGQVRTALDHALDAGSAGPELRRMFESAIAAGRRVRSRTALGRGIASVPQASVELVRERLGTLRHSTVLLIGAGTAAALAAKQLSKHGARELLVLGRDVARAERLAQQHGGRLVTHDQLDDALKQSDVVISSTSSPHHILHREQVEHARPDPGDSPLLLIDLAMPRDIDPAVAELPFVEVYTLDDLRQVVERALVRRRAELPAARAVMLAEVSRFTTWLRQRELVAA
jgi:glutamyl-tRNA reductase